LNPKKLNPINRFLQGKLIPDLSSPSCLSVTQAILLEHAKDVDAIGELIAQLDNKTITTSPELNGDTNPIHKPQHCPNDLWIGPAN